MCKRFLALLECSDATACCTMQQRAQTTTQASTMAKAVFWLLYLDNHISGGLFTIFDCAGVRPVEVLSVDGRRAAHATRHSVWVSLSQCEPVHITGQYFTFGRLTCFHCQTRLFTIFTSYENIVIFTKNQTVLRAV